LRIAIFTDTFQHAEIGAFSDLPRDGWVNLL
jgi:hypothetical protein